MTERKIYWWLLTHNAPWWMLNTCDWFARVRWCHHNARVLADMEYRFSCVLDHIGTRMSQAYYTLPAMYEEIDRAIRDTVDDELEDAIKEKVDEALAEYQDPLPEDEWHEDDGPVLWWKFPLSEPPYVGSPIDNDWPGYHTHWTRIPEPVEPGRVLDHPDEQLALMAKEDTEREEAEAHVSLPN